MSDRTLAARVEIPAPALAWWASLGDDCRAETGARLDAMRAVARERGRKGGSVGAVQAACAQALGVSPKTLQNLCTRYFATLQSDGAAAALRGLVDTRRWPTACGTGAVAQETREFIRVLTRKHQGGLEAAHGAFIRQWKRWLGGDPAMAIPGFATCPPDCGGGHPAGLSQRNFVRFAAKKWERKVMQRGVQASAANLPMVLSTRTATYPGARYAFDDMWHNVKVVIPALGQIVRPLQLSVVDMHSGSMFDVGFKPRLLRDDDTEMGLGDLEMRHFLAKVLMLRGYQSDLGTMLFAENGTAKIDEATERDLFDFTGGKITVDRSGIVGGEQALPGWYRGGAKGNPRHKAIIETLHRVLQNTEGLLPAPTGITRQTLPEWMAGLQKEDAAALKLFTALAERDPARAALLRYHALTWTQFVDVAEGLIHEMNAREDHEMEGWRELGYVVPVFRLDDRSCDWLTQADVLRLHDTERAQLDARTLAAPKKHMRERWLSPAAVWSTAQLTPIRPALACLLLRRDASAGEAIVERTQAGAYFVVSENRQREFYSAFVKTEGGSVEALTPGEKYQLVKNPFDPARLFVCDRDGGFLGLSERVERVNPLDRESVLHAMGTKRAQTAAMLTPLRAEHADDVREVQSVRTHNARVADGAPVTAAERKRDRAVRSADVTDEDVISAIGGCVREDDDQDAAAALASGLFSPDDQDNQDNQ